MEQQSPSLADTLYDLSIALKWLCEHDRSCAPCISSCLDALNRARDGLPPDPLEGGHWAWMCGGCRGALDAEMEEELAKTHRLLQNALEKTRGVVEKAKDALYHVGRLAYCLGKKKAPWHEVLRVLREGLFPGKYAMYARGQLRTPLDGWRLLERLITLRKILEGETRG